MARAMNFNAGPAALPLAALERAQRELLDLEGTGMCVIEHSHRGKAYEAVHNEAIALLRELLGVPDDYDVLFLQGGASQQFAVVPMNLLESGKSADYVLTGAWSQKALQGSQDDRQGARRRDAPRRTASSRASRSRASSSSTPNAAYVHITSNNTIFGTQWHEFPDVGKVPLVADMSSDIVWRPIDVSKFGLIYAGAQKNLGPSGLVVVIVKKELVERGRKDIPAIFQYRTHAENNSLYNTPPTFSIYLLRNVLDVVKEAGGLAAMEKHNRKKAELLYAAIDARPDFYRCPVERDSRSLMNVVFTLPSAELEAEFLADAQKQKMSRPQGPPLGRRRSASRSTTPPSSSGSKRSSTT